MARLFIGIPLNEEMRRRVRVYLKVLQKKHWQVRWEPEEKWHITLVFLGEVDDREIPKIITGLEPIKGWGPIKLTFEGMRQFPERSKSIIKERVNNRMAKPVKVLPKKNLVLPKVILMGVRGDLDRLMGLRKKVVERLRAFGLVLEQKSFRPHLTIGRVEAKAGYAHKAVMASEIAKLLGKERAGEWLVKEVAIFESQLKPQGSEYRIIGKIWL